MKLDEVDQILSVSLRRYRAARRRSRSAGRLAKDVQKHVMIEISEAMSTSSNKNLEMGITIVLLIEI